MSDSQTDGKDRENCPFCAGKKHPDDGGCVDCGREIAYLEATPPCPNCGNRRTLADESGEFWHCPTDWGGCGGTFEGEEPPDEWDENRPLHTGDDRE